MKEKIITLNDEYNKFWKKIEHQENFTLLRYGDGERSIMIGKSVTAQEGWISPNYVSKLGEDLLKTLNVNDDKVYYGISCPCCDSPAYYWYSTRIGSNNKTFANLFINKNYAKFATDFEQIKRDAVFIGNYRAQNKKIGNLNVLKYYTIDDDCISFWENDAAKMVEEIKNDFGNKNDLLYVVSAGPMSEPIITELFNNNPNNCYIDFGSSIDKYIHEKQTRPYMDENTIYAKQNCWMNDPKTTDFDVSVVLNLYKRPDSLTLQLKALECQTLRPKEILLFQDGIEGNYKIDISEELKNKFNLVKISDKNCGVWERFRFAKDTNSKYVCVFDDDTIPGENWLENCHTQMLKEEGLFGTIGILLETPERYAYEGFFRAGWDGPLDFTTQVDFVGHSWFFKKDWLNYLFTGTEEFQKFKTAAEDMSFSAQLQKQGIKTFVPPHPINDTSLWGSLPEYANKLGNSAGALYLTSTNMEKMNCAINKLLEKGWQPLIRTNPKYVRDIKKKLYLYRRQKAPRISILKKIKKLCGKIIRKIRRMI